MIFGFKVVILCKKPIYNQKKPKLLIFDAFTLLIREKNVAIYALLRCKMSQFTHFCGVKFLASKSGTWEFWTNFMSGLGGLFSGPDTKRAH